MATVNSDRANFDMAEQSDKLLFQYWGKADENYPAKPKWHLLAYHCQDVAAVAASWWECNLKLL